MLDLICIKTLTILCIEFSILIGNPTKGTNVAAVDDEGAEDKAVTTEEKWGKGGINRPIMRANYKYSMCPLHIAIEGDHMVIIFKKLNQKAM